MYKFPLANSSWDQNEYTALQKVIDNGHFTMGEYVTACEQTMAEYLQVPYVVMVNSGSSANLLIIASLFYTENEKHLLKAGDEIIVPAVSWSTSYFPLHQYGLKLKFVDIDLETLNYDIAELRKSISTDTKAVLAVNLLGNPNSFDDLQQICNDNSLILIEDNCESLGAKYNGQYAGTFGVLGSYSSFFSHHISTMEGGFISTRDEELYHILLTLRAHGWTRNLPIANHVTGKKSDDPFEESFKFVLPGYNVRPLELSGAVGIEQVKKLPGIIRERRNNAKKFQEVFNDHPYIQIQREISESSWFGFSMVLKDNAPFDRKQFVQKLDSAGFEVRPIVTGNFLKNPVVKYFNYSVSSDLKNATIMDERGLFIGNHHYDMSEAMEALSKF